jgi:hypothetical protein
VRMLAFALHMLYLPTVGSGPEDFFSCMLQVEEAFSNVGWREKPRESTLCSSKSPVRSPAVSAPVTRKVSAPVTLPSVPELGAPVFLSDEVHSFPCVCLWSVCYTRTHNVYICTRTLYIYIYIYCVRVYACVYIYVVSECMCVCNPNVHVYICMCMRIYICVYIHM